MDTIQQITTAPETDDVERLYNAYKLIHGNEPKSLYEFWLFMTTPSTERDFFLGSRARSVPKFVDNLVMDKYEGIC